RSANPEHPNVHVDLAAAYALKGETDRAATELAEARRLSSDGRYSSITRLKAAAHWGVPKIHALYEATYFVGLRKAGCRSNEHRPRRLLEVREKWSLTPISSEGELIDLFGLSRAEARLAAGLMTGKNLTEIAGEVGLQVATLRTQLRSILKKVGAKRQSDLVRIFANAGIGSR
ncbi:MAG TPA: hypothetical protein VGF39_12980, partial [Stellaceae bacterium]